MQNSKITKIINILLSVFLGGLLLFGGIKKFEKPTPSPAEQIEKIQKGELKNDDVSTLKIKNYVFGMRQTDYFWQLLGVTEILFGLLILSQIFRLLGSIMALPITLNIFLFHMFLEPHEVGELIQMIFLLAINIWLIVFEFPKWKNIIFNKSII